MPFIHDRVRLGFSTTTEVGKTKEYPSCTLMFENSNIEIMLIRDDDGKWIVVAAQQNGLNLSRPPIEMIPPGLNDKFIEGKWRKANKRKMKGNSAA